MQPIRKALFATAIAAGFIANAQAAATIQTLDITWYKDGKVIDQAQHIVNDGTSLTPYLQRGGKEVGYANCTGSAGAMRLSAEKMFVGRSLLINPVSANAGKVQLSVSATDTALDGIRKTGTADCTSEVVDVHGYTASDIPVEIADGQTVDVPLKNPQYKLVLRLHRDAL
ncbi:hypothetical protein PPGU19_101240 (plasmid) [Paraburkholderia sp. PGU19]|uniref:hypothetical protein n=1 Tax=Paraburkholderia sp. PGU19 TaxID=2735434 RepID=UPI0015D9B099|nr:hypothetical protein [Paraburkholderia sp. PGU19]BCG05556.1 hypothetical protein PPGU19_101240 [Paraburkholderia sp. PGU19]